MQTDHLRIYMNDHLAGSTGGMELAKRLRDSNADMPFAGDLERLAEEIVEERETLKKMMDALGTPENPAKQGIAWVGERISRLKPNDQLTGYSPLSRLIETETLKLGVTGKLGLWRVLEALGLPELESFDVPGLAARAEQQRDLLERLRMEAAQAAFAA